MTLGACGALAGLIWFTGCARVPESYPLPPQRERIQSESPILRPFVEMSSPMVFSYVVRDVLLRSCGKGWCWTGARPELRFRPAAATRQKFRMDFGVVPATFQVTGPVTLSVWINGKLLGKMPCPAPGDRRFEMPVPAKWLSTEEDAVVVAQVDKLYTAGDGVQLGFVLHRAGFVE